MLLGLLLTGFRGMKVVLVIGLAVLLLTTLLLSLSRGGWLGATAGLFFMGIALFLNGHFQSKKMVFSLGLGFVFVTFIVLSSTTVVEKIRTVEKMGNYIP